MHKQIATIVLTLAIFGALAIAADRGSASESTPAALASPSAHHILDHFHSRRLAGLPSKWDKRIPLPDGTTVTEVKPPSGAAQAVEFRTAGDYDQTIAFYKEALPKAGFEPGPEVKVPARKVYNLNFTRAKIQDTLTIFPDKTDPSKMALRIVYTPEKGWIRTKLAKWEDRAKILPKWWRHHEEEKREKSEKKTSAKEASDSPPQPSN